MIGLSLTLKPRPLKKETPVMRGAKPKIISGSNTLKSAPKPPIWLSKEAKIEWKRVAPILVERGTLTEGDLGMLESYCTAVGTIRAGQALINAEGLTVIGPQGVKRHPAVGIVNSAQTTARQAANELGLTPVSRSRPVMRDDADSADMSFLG